MQQFKTAPQNQDAYNRLGHAAAVCAGVIIVFSIIGVLTEVMPLQSMANAAIGQYIAPLIGERITFFITAFLTATFVIYLATEHVKASKAAFNTIGKDAYEIRQTLTPVGVALLWVIVLFIIVTRVGLTFIGSHQIAYVAVQPPKLNTDAITANDTLYNIRKREAVQEYEKQKAAIEQDNAKMVKAIRNAAISEENAALRAVKDAPNEYRRNIARRNLETVRANNAAKIADAKANAVKAMNTFNNSQKNVITANDSLNVQAKSLLLAADAHKQSRFFWLSDKLTTYFPYVSLVCVLLVTLAVFVQCMIYRAAGIKIEFQQGKYDNVPGLAAVWLSVFHNILQSRLRQFAAWLQSALETDIFKGDEVKAAAIGASETVQIKTTTDVKTVNIAGGKPEALPIKEVPPPDERNVITGKAITLKQAEMQLNAYRSYLKRGERNPETCKARIKYLSHLINHMKSKGIYEMVAPDFNPAEWQ